MIPVNLAVEDELSEAVLRRLLRHADKGYEIGTCYGRGGFGYLRKTISGWNRAAKGRPFVVLTDLDDRQCPTELITNWLAESRHPNLLFRIAVREVESWLLADAENIAEYLVVRAERVPAAPDALDDPKECLVELARTSRSGEIKSRIVPRARSTAKQGPDYNACLRTFVEGMWNVEAARGNSPSLDRTARRFSEFVPLWPK